MYFAQIIRQMEMKQIMMNDKRERLNLRLTQDEYNTIKTKATESNKLINTYIKEAAINGFIINHDYKYIDEYSKNLIEYTRAINLLTHSILITGEYFPSDLQMIQEQLNDLLKMKKRLYQKINRDNKRILKTIYKINNGGNDC